MLISPGAIAFLLTRSFGAMLVLSVAIGTAASFAGVYASFFIDSAPAPTIVLLMTIAFMGAFTWSVVRTARTEKRAARDART